MCALWKVGRNCKYMWLSPLDCKEIQPVHSKGDQPWVFFGRNYATAETPVLWPPHAKSWLIGKNWCWEGLEAGGEGDDRGWDSWMSSPTRLTWVWVNSGRWWWTGRPGVLRFMGLQRVGQDWATELNWTEGWNKLCRDEEGVWCGHDASSKLKQALSNSAHSQLYTVVLYWWQARDNDSVN